MQPEEEFEQVNLQIVQGQAPTRISLQREELVKNKQTKKQSIADPYKMTVIISVTVVITFLCW